MRKKVFVSTVGCALIMFFSTLSLAEENSAKLVDEDCVKCHLGEAQAIDERGALHKTEVGCLDCHEKHPPSKEGVIPACAMCHGPEDKTHYTLENCASCHHPHYPMEIDFSKIDNLKPTCLSCHPDQGKEMDAHPSEHAVLDCKECHMEHGESAGCMECHEPHTDEMTLQDCVLCHKPHGPTAIKFEGVVPSALCSGCHEGPIQEIDERGAAHKEVDCIDCHLQHPPSEEGVIPACAMCHAPEDEDHYRLEDCASCHHPHYPMEMDFSTIDNVKPACLSCHPDQGKEMDAHPSEHAGLDCKECHMEHGESAGCMECHDPHADTMTVDDCLLCHKPHMPVEVTYAENIPSFFCSSCHEIEGKGLAKSTTKHHELGCAYCHRNKHKAAIECGTCHGEPHSFDIHAKHSDCLRCHQDPHALIR